MRTRRGERERILSTSTCLWPLLFLVFLAGCGSTSVRRPPPPPPGSAAREIDLAQEEAARLSKTSVVGADVRAAPRRLWDDTKLVFGSGRNWLLLAGAGAYAFAQEEWWEDSEEDFFREHTLFGSDAQQFLGALGNGATLCGGALIWYYVAMERDDARGYEDSKTLLSALTVTALTTGLLKTTITDARPSGGNQDFPSGHASISMATAATLGELYGPAFGVPAYTLAGLVGLQRLDVEKHDTGAVVFGWMLGFVVGQTIAAQHAPRILGLDLGLYVDPDSGDLGLSLSSGL